RKAAGEQRPIDGHRTVTDRTGYSIGRDFMAFVIYGAGAIGGILAARLSHAGEDVVVIARGDSLRTLGNGLSLEAPTGDWRARFVVVGHPSERPLRSTDVVILAMKTQDTLVAVEELALAAPGDTPIVCAQNGVENERIVLRRFQNVYGAYVFVFGHRPASGIVQCFTAPSFGVVDVGRYPRGLDDVARRINDTLVRAGFDAVPRTGIMRWKYAKLLANLGNAFDAACGGLGGVADLYEAAQDEGRACYTAAGIDYVGAKESADRHRHLLPLGLVNGTRFPGGSMWQSLARHAGTTEVDYLNGEIVLLGRRLGVATPVNRALQDIMRTMALGGHAPASLEPSELRARLAGLRA
ncbi:MAG: NAD(P)-binding domain-containing protein, partial [Pseudomonadota bacterium]|nr:NAD(P)-binding domain-containing protein [Pseudomonadota bacterium]